MIDMNRLTCYQLEGHYYEKMEDDWVGIYGGGYRGYKTYWATPPSAEQIAVASLRLMEAMNRDRSFWHDSMKIEWTFFCDAPLRDLLDQLPLSSPILEEYAQPSIGRASSPESVWPYVVGGAVLFG